MTPTCPKCRRPLRTAHSDSSLWACVTCDEGYPKCCTHPQTHTGFCFACYQRDRDAKYAALTENLERELTAGATLLETWPGGQQTAWRWIASDSPTSAQTLAQTLKGAGSGIEHEAFIAGQTARYVADHLANRSRGFGTTVTVVA